MSRPGSLFDSNVWVALSFARHAGFEIAKAEFEKHDSHRPIIVCRSIQQSFLRLITTILIQQAYQEEPITNREAWTRWMDAYLGGFALEHGIEITTFDRAFTTFKV